MTNSKPIKKNIKRKRRSRVVGVLIQLVKAIKITKRILNLKVKLMVDKLLTFILFIEKQLTKAIINDKTI